ncbi:MAG: hypothetical protein IPK35_19225 [Saprospiraceae bacterium]|jgi:hypothetical protein|nr:hypothetical protein [Saprospiraceae bacterium]
MDKEIILKNKQVKITAKHKEVISESFILFVNWLRRQNLKNFNYKTAINFDIFPIDNTMKVDETKSIHFNLAYLQKCSVDYFVTIILHEAYHYYINNIPNKRDATRVKDFYYDEMMQHIDIEADFYVAKFLKEEYNLILEDYLNLYYSGSNAFRDEEIRPQKLQRFVCSMLTIAHLYLHNEFAIYRVNLEAIRLLGKNPRIILHKKGYSETKVIKFSLANLNKIQKLYQFPSIFTPDQYVETLYDVLFSAVDGSKSQNVQPKLNYSNLRNKKS